MRPGTLVPSSALRVIDRARNRRFLSTTGPPTVEYVRRNGLTVTRGPFAGMRYLEGFERTSGDLVAKLTGAYERELHGAIGEWVAAGPEHVIDIGCAEGYYAVGLALAIPGATVYAFDIDEQARARCAQLAELNGVADRVRVAGECTPGVLNGFPERGVALLSDCEGAEVDVLDPSRAPRLAGWSLLVELHEFIDASIPDTLSGRFENTHEIGTIDGEDRQADELPELDFMTQRQREAVLSERRPGPMRWAQMRPRARSR
jgi:hypothetical protein